MGCSSTYEIENEEEVYDGDKTPHNYEPTRPLLITTGTLSKHSIKDIYKYWRFRTHSYSISTFISLQDLRLAIGFEDGTIKILTIETFSKHWEIFCEKLNAHPFTILYICEIKPSHQIASTSIDNKVKVWNISYQKFTLIKVITDYETPVNQILSLPNNRFIACSLYDTTIRIFSTEPNFKSIFQLKNNTVIYCLLLLVHSHNTLITSHNEPSMIKYWNIKSYEQIGFTLNVCSLSVNGMKELPNGNIAIVVKEEDYSGHISIVDPKEKVIVMEIKDENYILFEGVLCLLNDNSFIVCFSGIVCQVLIDGFKIVFGKGFHPRILKGEKGVLIYKNYIITDNEIKGITFHRYDI